MNLLSKNNFRPYTQKFPCIKITNDCEISENNVRVTRRKKKHSEPSNYVNWCPK